jgi:hypothetical protein
MTSLQHGFDVQNCYSWATLEMVICKAHDLGFMHSFFRLPGREPYTARPIVLQ